MNFLDTTIPKIANYAIIAMFVITALSFFKSCSSQKEDIRMKKEIIKLDHKMDSLYGIIEAKTISEQQMKTIIKETVSWETLTIEELSDKEHIPINHYRNEEKKDNTLK